MSFQSRIPKNYRFKASLNMAFSKTLQRFENVLTVLRDSFESAKSYVDLRIYLMLNIKQNSF